MNRHGCAAIGAIGLVALATACDDHIMGHGAPIQNNCLRDPPLTYENLGEGMIGRHCLSCHSVHVRENLRGGAPLQVDFDSWDDVLDWSDRILARAVDTDGMPPAATMRPDERALLGEWMRCEVLPVLGEVEIGGEQGEDP